MSGETTPRAKAQMVMPVLPDLDMLNLGDKNNKQEAEAQGRHRSLELVVERHANT